MFEYTYSDAERDGQRLAESIGGANAYTESVRRAIRDSYERAFYAGYYAGTERRAVASAPEYISSSEVAID